VIRLPQDLWTLDATSTPATPLKPAKEPSQRVGQAPRLADLVGEGNSSSNQGPKTPPARCSGGYPLQRSRFVDQDCSR